MRTRLALATAVLASLALAAPHALAAPTPKTLDGKAVRTLSITATSDLQNNVDNPVPDSCVAPRCALLPFVFSPAKGVKGDVLFTLSWGDVASDLDMYIVQVGKNGSYSEVVRCAGLGPTKERVFVPSGTFKRGKTYALVIDFYRSFSATAKGTIEMPGKDSVSKTVPESADSFVVRVNCTL